MKVFVVYDSKAEAYGMPFYQRSVGEAIRGFAQAAKDPNVQLSKSPEDFTLFQIGTYDEFAGTFQLLETKHALGTALELRGPQ